MLSLVTDATYISLDNKNDSYLEDEEVAKCGPTVSSLQGQGNFLHFWKIGTPPYLLICKQILHTVRATHIRPENYMLEMTCTYF